MGSGIWITVFLSACFVFQQIYLKKCLTLFDSFTPKTGNYIEKLISNKQFKYNEEGQLFEVHILLGPLIYQSFAILCTKAWIKTCK